MGMLDDSIPDRYLKNPMLAVLENYVLDAIGELDADKSKLLNEMICKTFGGTDWKAVIRQQFDLPKETDENLQLLWKQRREEATELQADLIPAEDFAREVVDEMFRDLGN